MFLGSFLSHMFSYFHWNPENRSPKHPVKMYFLIRLHFVAKIGQFHHHSRVLGFMVRDPVVVIDLRLSPNKRSRLAIFARFLLRYNRLRLFLDGCPRFLLRLWSFSPGAFVLRPRN